MLGPKPAYKILVIMFNYNFLVLKNAKIAIFGRLRGPNIVEKLKFFATEHFLSSVTPIRKPLNKIEKKCQMKHPRRPMSTPPLPTKKMALLDRKIHHLPGHQCQDTFRRQAGCHIDATDSIRPNTSTQRFRRTHHGRRPRRSARMIDARGPSGAQRRPTFVDFQAGRRRLRPSVEEWDLHSVLYSLKKISGK